MESSIDRRARHELANFGQAIGEPSRAAILIALMGGTERPASELARIARVAPSTATSHLRHLEQAGLVVVRTQGRHRYFALAGAHVASAVESLAAYASEARQKPSHAGDPFAEARTCYGHLAGRLAVAFWQRARGARWVEWSDVAVTLLPAGGNALAKCALLPEAHARTVGRPCLDWSERVPHVAGPLGVALFDALLARRWVARAREGRAIRITPRGHEGLHRLGVTWEQ